MWLMLDSLAAQYLLLKHPKGAKLCPALLRGGHPGNLLSHAGLPGGTWDRRLVQDPRFCSGDSCPPIIPPGHSPVTQGSQLALSFLPLTSQVCHSVGLLATPQLPLPHPPCFLSSFSTPFFLLLILLILFLWQTITNIPSSLHFFLKIIGHTLSFHLINSFTLSMTFKHMLHWPFLDLLLK